MRVVRHLERTAIRRAHNVEPLARRWWIEQGIQTGADAYTKRVQRRLDDDQRAELARRGLKIGDPVLELPPGTEEQPPWVDNPQLLARAIEPRAILYGALDEGDYLSLVWIDGTDVVPPEVEKALHPAKALLDSRAAIQRDSRRRWYETAWPRDKERLRQPKVIALYRTDRGRFAVDEDGSWQPSIKTTICTAREPGLSVRYLCGLLNSELLDIYYAVRGKTPWHVRRNYEPTPMARLPYRHVARLPDAEAATGPLTQFVDVLERDPRSAAQLLAALPPDPFRIALGVEMLVDRLRRNRMQLLGHRVASPPLRAQVKDPWRDVPVSLDLAGVIAGMPASSVRSVRIDPELRLELETTAPFRFGSLEGDRLALMANRRAVGVLCGPHARLAFLAQLLEGVRMTRDELLATLVPRDLQALEREVVLLHRDIHRLIADGRALVEAIERLVCKLYGVPEALTDEIVEHAVHRARRGVIMDHPAETDLDG